MIHEVIVPSRKIYVYYYDVVLDILSRKTAEVRFKEHFEGNSLSLYLYNSSVKCLC